VKANVEVFIHQRSTGALRLTLEGGRIMRRIITATVPVLVLAVFFASGCSESDLDTGNVAAPGPDLIVFRAPNLQPEGIEYDARRGRFVVGSRTEGTIHTVDDAGNVAVLVADPGLSITLGLQIDGERLLAAGSLGTGEPALGIYDVETGAVLRVVNLGGLSAAPAGHLANDVAVDHEGNAYVTDTLARVIYRVTPAGNASLFADDPRFGLLNGIEFHPDGFLVVASIGGPRLFRVPIDASAAVTEVDTPFTVTGDGIVFRPDGSLAIVSNALAADGTVLGPGVTLFTSDDGWQSAAVAGSWTATAGPTTAAVRANDVHVIYAHLFDTTREEYEIVKASFTE
jgi:sugar lactone lactonase YvrE